MPSLPHSNLSQNANTPLPSMKKHRDPVKWVVAEEAAIISTLLLQKATGNSLKSGFKPMMWPLVVNAVSQATSLAIKKNLQLCKTCYHRVHVQFFFGVQAAADYF